nr:hypothetical protein Iba_chr01bCG1560 [Ipomoea batatas]
MAKSSKQYILSGNTHQWLRWQSLVDMQQKKMAIRFNVCACANSVIDVCVSLNSPFAVCEFHWVRIFLSHPRPQNDETPTGPQFAMYAFFNRGRYEVVRRMTIYHYI